ncbi:MAG: serine--tRNA ligase [Candidatus Nealsonbacteria bacterium CG08_land_8_20_14_0_20_36_22]|uniref:Serine--tRNA ligase n=2 Tax=Candidatus Nealsoniibacteriota TaxID=1817911 RepID=A0A2H0YP86_9BACT|nr:MAG: serine--tRNA ligase [Candidatus Nealsonbacteria bacterium CG08_land_8_20_14_0_20_36_22]
MLDIKFIRENPEKVKQACKNKGFDDDIDKLLELDKKRRSNIITTETLQARQNKLGKKDIEEARKIKAEIIKIAPNSKKIEQEFNNLMSQIPNIPFDDVPVGKDDTQNIVIRKVGKIPEFKFQPKDYMEIGEKLELIDVARASKVAGTRFGYLRNEAVLMEFALVKLAFDLLTKKGFLPVLPPVMLKKEMAKGTGYFEAADKEEAYFIPEDKLFLAGTSEQSLIAMHAGEILPEKDLPKRYVGFSTCFRREAGSYGKDTKGILRVHQFDKAEMVSFCKPEDSKKEHQFFLSLEEKLMKSLKLPYQVVNICTGDLGKPAAAKYDIETWIPSENKYRETHSTSNCTDFQARRLEIKYRDKNNKLNFVHTLNGTAFAVGRTLIAIIENCQQKDGSIKVPKVLQKYTGFKIIRT